MPGRRTPGETVTGVDVSVAAGSGDGTEAGAGLGRIPIMGILLTDTSSSTAEEKHQQYRRRFNHLNLDWLLHNQSGDPSPQKQSIQQ
jgi:hypothetical protein